MACQFHMPFEIGDSGAELFVVQGFVMEETSNNYYHKNDYGYDNNQNLLHIIIK
jgi:hypothetical protein